MARNLNNIVVDRVLRGIFTDKHGNVIFSLNQIQDLSLNQTSESQEVQDAFGVSIMELMRSKAIEASANNAIYDFGLLAAQYGTTKVEAKADAKLTVPTMEAFEAPESKEYALKHAPTAAPVAIYELNGDSTLGAKYVKGTAATATEFACVIDEESGVATISLPTGITKGTEMFVMYEYEATAGVAVTANAIDFPKRGEFIMEVLGCDVCDQEELIHAFVEFPNAKLDGNVDYSFTTDGTHPFTIKAMQDYCNKEKVLFRVIVPDEE